LNPEPSPDEPKKKKPRNRGRKKKKKGGKIDSEIGVGCELDGEVMTSKQLSNRGVPMSLMANPMNCAAPTLMSSVQGTSTHLPNDIDGDELSDMSMSEDELLMNPNRNVRSHLLRAPEKSLHPIPPATDQAVIKSTPRALIKNVRPSSKFTENSPTPITRTSDCVSDKAMPINVGKKFLVNLISGENAEKIYPPKCGEIYETGSSLYKCVERPYFGTIFDSKSCHA
jgi:hypothetical protein